MKGTTFGSNSLLEARSDFERGSGKKVDGVVGKHHNMLHLVKTWYITIIINGTLARSLEPVVTECKEHTIHTQTQVVASRKPKEIKRTHEGEANLTT